MTMIEPQINLEFTEKHKYYMEFSPPEFWKPFADVYEVLEWEERSDGKVAVIAENYSYLLDLLVRARQYYLSTKPYEERFK
jgi:hypothetical protein